MRELHDHKTNLANEQLTVEVCDTPGSGNASHHYAIGHQSWGDGVDILFQNGPIKECGVNGITHEVLLAILIDRLRGFQSGQYACRENALALTKLEEALMWLGSRTKARVARGVECTHEV